MEKQQLEALLKEMSLEEKVGQLFQIIGYYYVEEEKSAISFAAFSGSPLSK